MDNVFFNLCVCACVYGVGVAMAESGPPAAKRANNGGKKVVMVTGGTGLVGQALKEQVELETNPGEEWVFLSSRDADLW